MKRVIVSILISTALVLAASAAVDAQRGKRNRGKGKSPRTAQSSQIAPMMGEIRWGWSPKELANHFIRKIQAEYRPKIQGAPGVIEAEAMRHERDEKIRLLKKSYVTFKGETSGYDSGFLRFEFTHNNGEALLRAQSDVGEDYYFFIQGKLWKWYRAFRSDLYEGASFEQFSQGLEQRFGRASHRSGKLHEHAEATQWLEWQDGKTRLRAIDNTTFFGFYCLVFESREMLGQIDSLRKNTTDRGPRRHALVEAVTSGPIDEADDGNQDIADRITGKIRNRQQAK